MVLKFVIGFSTNSLGILSESMHSGLDFIAAFMTFSAIRIVMRPPDSRYTYGYAKFESIVSLAEIILLFAVAGWVFYEGIERISTSQKYTTRNYSILICDNVSVHRS